MYFFVCVFVKFIRNFCLEMAEQRGGALWSDHAGHFLQVDAFAGAQSQQQVLVVAVGVGQRLALEKVLLSVI